MAWPDCIDDGNGLGFDIGCSSDINEFETQDLQDLTLSGVGTTGVEIIPLIGFIVILLLLAFALGMLIKFKNQGKGLAR